MTPKPDRTLTLKAAYASVGVKKKKQQKNQMLPQASGDRLLKQLVSLSVLIAAAAAAAVDVAEPVTAIISCSGEGSREPTRALSAAAADPGDSFWKHNTGGNQ